MSYDIKEFQLRYSLANKDIAAICQCSLPTIQKWRSGDVPVSGAAAQLLRFLDLQAQGSATGLREALLQLDMPMEGPAPSDSNVPAGISSIPQTDPKSLEAMLEQQRRDRALAQSEARYESMVEASANPICRWQPDSTLTYVNSTYADLFRHCGKDLVGKRWIQFLPEHERPTMALLLADMVRRGEEETSVHEIIDAGGRKRFFEWRDTPVRNHLGEITEWHSVAYDVTELVSLRRQQEEARGIRNAFFSLAEKPVVLFDQSGEFREMNELFRWDILGTEKWKGFEDMLGGVTAGKFKRLLKRVKARDAFCYQLQLDNLGAFRLNGRLISRSGENAQYMAVVDKLVADYGNPVVQVRLQNEVILDGQALTFIKDPEVRESVNQRMDQLGHTVDVDRIYVFTFDMTAHLFDNVLEWCADGVQSHIDDLQRIPMSEYPWWIQRIQRNQWIEFEDTSKMPRSAFREREILMAQQICSLMVAPVVVNGEAVGFVGFDHNHTERVWHEQERKLLDDFREDVEELMRGMITER